MDYDQSIFVLALLIIFGTELNIEKCYHVRQNDHHQQGIKSNMKHFRSL